MSDGEQTRLLIEIRDILREQLEEYRRVTSESLAMTRASVEKQRQAAEYAMGLGRLYRVVVAVLGTVALVGLAWLLFSALR